MRTVSQQARFRQDLIRLKRRRKDVEDLIAVVEMIAEHGRPPPECKPHQLSGRWKGIWECHIEPDWLLVYSVTPKEVLLIRTGTHKDLFMPG